MARASDLQASNQLLAALPVEEFELMRPNLVDVELPAGHILFNPGDILHDVYFPTTAVIALMSVMRDGQPVEVAAVGHEGMVGVRLFYDDDEAFARAVCEVPGHVRKMETELFWKFVKSRPGMRHIARHYAHAFLIEAFQSAACNRVHTLPERFARWLLTKQDRARTSTFALTRDLIAEMLAITQHGASALLAQLTQERLIDYEHEVVEIVNRPGLESMACECYERITIELDKIRVRRQMRDT